MEKKGKVIVISCGVALFFITCYYIYNKKK